MCVLLLFKFLKKLSWSPVAFVSASCKIKVFSTNKQKHGGKLLPHQKARCFSGSLFVFFKREAKERRQIELPFFLWGNFFSWWLLWGWHQSRPFATHPTDEFQCWFLFVDLLRDANQAVSASTKSTISCQCHSDVHHSLLSGGKRALSLAALLKRLRYAFM